MDGERVDHHAAFVAFDLAHLIGVFLDRKIAVQNAHTTGLGHGDGQTAVGDRIHRRRHQGNVQIDFTRKPRPRVHLRGHDVGGTGFEQNIVEGKTFTNLHETLRFAGRV